MSEEYDLTAESLIPGADLGGGAHPLRTVPLPYEERSRRAILIVWGALAAALIVAQVVCAFVLDPADYQVPAAALSGPATIIAATVGAATLYYFTQPRTRRG